MEFNALTTQHISGAVSEAMVAAYLVQQGYPVFTPMVKQTRCDLVYLKPEPIRVQVKTGTFTRSGAHAYEQCRLVNKGCGHGTQLRYNTDEMDELWVVGTHLWRFPASVFCGRTSLSLLSTRDKPSLAISANRGYDADEYIVEHGSIDAPYRKRLAATSSSGS